MKTVMFALTIMFVALDYSPAQTMQEKVTNLIEEKADWIISGNPKHSIKEKNGNTMIRNEYIKYNKEETKQPRYLLAFKESEFSWNDNFTIEAELKKTSKARAGYGVAWNIVNENEFSACVLWDNGNWDFYQVKNGKKTKTGEKLVKKYETTSSKKEPAKIGKQSNNKQSNNKLKVEKTSQKYVIYINDKKVGTAPIGEFMSKTAGVYINAASSIEIIKYSITHFSEMPLKKEYKIPDIALEEDQIKTFAVQMGHADYVTSLSFSPDGSYLVSGSYDYTVKLWDLKSGKEIKNFIGHNTEVNSVAFSPDGKYIASAGGGVTGNVNTIKLWDVASGRNIRTYEGHQGWILCVAFSPDNKLLASGSLDKTIRIWDVKSGKQLKTLSGHTAAVYSIAFSPDGKNLAAAGGAFTNEDFSISKDFSIEIWDFKKGALVNTLDGHPNIVSSLKYTPDGKYLVSACHEGLIKWWNAKSGQLERTFKGYRNGIYSIAFSPDGKYLISGNGHVYTGNEDNTIRLWDCDSGKELRAFSGHRKSVSSVAYSPDGKWIASGSQDSTIKIWNVYDGSVMHTFIPHITETKSICPFNQGQNLAYIQSGHSIKIWDLNKYQLINTLKGHSKPILRIDISPNGKLLASGGKDKIVNIWEISGNTLLRTLPIHKDWIVSICFSPDGNGLATGDFRDIRLWDIASGKDIRLYSGHINIVTAIRFSQDGQRFLASSGAGDHVIRLWDINHSKEIRSFMGHNSTITSIDYSADGKSFISGSNDNTINVYDINQDYPVKTLEGHDDYVTSVSYSSDYKYSASSSLDKKIKLWDISKHKVIKDFIGHDNGVLSTAFFENDQKLVSSSYDGTIKLWDIKSGKEIVTLVTPGFSDWIIYTPDGYFDCSSNGGEGVAMVFNHRGFGIDQFAVRNNRPDIILQRLGSTDKELIEHYYQQYKKRLRKLGLTEDQLSSELHVPSSTITDTKQDGKFVTLNFKISDDKYNLRQYNIYLNDVPVFGIYGKSISGNTQNLTEKIELTTGDNKIEISCMNEKGAESYRALTYATYNEPVKGDLYYLAFGVSKYQDQKLNLKYADKDATDLGQVFDKMKGKSFNNVFIKTYTNEQVTVDNIKQAKDFLKNSKVDDTFVLFIAGHGMHDKDKEATYYFLTYNAQADNLSVSAANFELIEDLLQGIPPRNKLFLMDTCESGELEEGMETNYFAQADTRGLKARAARGMVVKDKTTKETKKSRTYLFEKDRYIYNDLLRRSGAIVFSSSKGGEFSYERDELQNGLFTEEIINALTTNKADKNSDGIISTDELRDYVSKAVSDLSGDLQHPTVDRDNIYQKFGFGIR